MTVPKKYVCVCGGPRTGSNMIAAVVHALGFPTRRNAWRQRDQMMQTGSYGDQAFIQGRVKRQPPWVFKCHGFKRDYQTERFLKLHNLVVIHTTRDMDEVVKSMEWCLSLKKAGGLK